MNFGIMTEEFVIPDMFKLEMMLQAKIHELQWKTEALDKLNAELNQNRQTLYDERMLLEKERRRVKELELHLKRSFEMIEFLEKNKLKNQQEKIELQINCDTARKERESLLNQARNAKVENIQLLSRIQQLEEETRKQEVSAKAVGSTLEQLKNEMAKTAQNQQRNFAKLKQEQDQLRQSVELTTKLNQRLKVAGMCVHIEHRKQNETIKELQTRLNEASVNQVWKPDVMESFIDLPRMKDIQDKTSNMSDSDEDLDRQVEAFIEELQKADGMLKDC